MRNVRRAGAALAAVLLAAVLPMLLAPSPASAATTAISLTTFGDVVVDPTSNRVFVSGDDKVVAFDAAGTQLGTVTDVYGARGMVVSNGYLWVAETTGAAVAKINPATLNKVGEFAAGKAVSGSITASGSTLLVASPGSQSYTYDVLAIDQGTGAVTNKGKVSGQSFLAVPGAPNRLVAADTSGGSPYSIELYDITGTATSLGDIPFGAGSNLGDAAVTDVGTVVAAAGAPYRFDEFSLTPESGVLQPTGVVYPGTNYPNGVATSAANGGMVAGTASSSNEVYVSRRGAPLTTHLVSLPGDPLDSGIALSANGKTLYDVVEGTTTGQVRLVTTSLAPTLSGVTVTTAVAGRTTRTYVTGTGLGSITAVTLGGVPVEFAHDGPTTLELDIETALAPGNATLSMTGPFGNLSAPFTVVANTSSTVSGTVTSGGAAVSGASISLASPDGPTRTATSAANGTWSITSVPQGAHYDLTVTGSGATVHLDDRSLTLPGSWDFDVDLLAPPARTLESRRVELPPGEVRNVTADPATGKVFVAVGDQIVAFDQAGNELARIHDQWTADELQVVGGKLYAMLHRAGVVSRIDTTTLAVDRTIKLNRLTTGSFVVTGNRLHFTNGDDQWTNIAGIDLTTEAITNEAGSQYTPRYAPIDGSTTNFLSFEQGISSSDITNWDASGASLTKVAVTPFSTFGYDPIDFVASSSAGKVWAADGKELTLSTMAPTGVTYPKVAANAVARSAGHSGVLAFGQSVSRQGAPSESHRLPVAPAIRSLALDAGGDHAYQATADGQFVVSGLAPVVMGISPKPLLEQPANLVVTGAGLGAASAVKVDGSAVAFTKVDSTKLNISVSGLADGLHELTVTTPWGVSSPIGLPVGQDAITHPYDPFTSWSELVKRVWGDLAGAQPSATSLNTWVSSLSTGSLDKGDLVDALRKGTDHTTNVDPTARLYRAFLGRTPDAGGLKFWVGRKRAGTWTVTKMADSFASSNEFKTKYGSLTNRQFVTRIYTDVLGRTADAAGVNYWTGKLDRKEKTRGQVMVGFSESSEYKRKQAENTDVAVVYIFLLGRAPTAGEVTAWVTAQKGGTLLADLATALLDSPAYATHITG